VPQAGDPRRRHARARQRQDAGRGRPARQPHHAAGARRHRGDDRQHGRRADQAAPDLNRTLRRTPALTRKLAGVFSDLIADKQSLRTLVGSTSNVVDAWTRANPELRVLLDGFARTADAVASESGAMKDSLDTLPAALRQTRTTLGRAEGTLNRAADLTDDIAPGVAQLRKTSGPLTAHADDAQAVSRRWRSTRFRRPSRRASRARDLVETLGSIAPRVTVARQQAATQIGCLRPTRRRSRRSAARGGTGSRA